MKLSVIVPVYNVEDYLEKCLLSALKNDSSDYEILVVDDGATDSSPAVAEKMREKYPDRIRIIHQENRGLGGARNTGIENARGEYLYFLDSDDTIAEHALDTLLRTAETYDADLVLFNTLFVDDDKRVLKKIRGCEKCDELLSLESYPDLINELPSACNKMFRRSLFTESGIRFPDRAWYEDLRTTLKIYPLAKRIVGIDEDLYFYLQRQGSIMNSGASPRIAEMCTAMDDVRGYYESAVGEQYKNELEQLAFHHELMLATRRANTAERGCKLQDEIAEHFFKQYPNYRKDPFFSRMNRYDRVVSFFIEKKCHLFLHLFYRFCDYKNRKK